jgi:hypothetical protein
MVGGTRAAGRWFVWGLRRCEIFWFGVDGGVVVLGGGVGFGWVIALSFGNQALFQAVNTLQKGLEDVCLWSSFFGNSVIYTRTVEHLTGFTSRPCAIALDLSLSTTLAVHGLSGLVRNAAGGKSVDTDLRSSHCGGQ